MIDTKRYHYDTDSDVLYIQLKNGKEDSCEEILPGINVEVDKKGNVLGIEVLNASHLEKNKWKMNLKEYVKKIN